MTKIIPRLLLKDYTTAENRGHFARTIMNYETHHDLHTHDFYEIFWVEKGEGWHHINNKKMELKVGSLCLIKPTDIHGFNSKAGSRLIIANIAFPADTYRHLTERYPSSQLSFDKINPLSSGVALDENKLLELSRSSQFLGEGPISLLRTEWFILGLSTFLNPPDSSSEYQDLPEWLRFACQQIQHNMAFHEGTKALAKFSGRSPEHVARTLRKLKGITPTDIVNTARVKYCANALATTEDKIAQIALDAGFQNLGYFYQVFQKSYQTSPRQYRLQQRSIFRGKTK